MKRLEGKVAIVTGANSGIGKTTAEVFAAEGAKVVLTARRMGPLEDVANAIKASGGEALAVSGDVSVYEDCARVCKTAFDTYGKIDILVNNAGVADKHRPITRCSNDWWAEIVAINQDSVFYMTKEALVYMEKAMSGSIVNISSIGGVRGNAGISYSASKAAVLGMTKNVAIQFAGQGIRCNAVCPGPTPTPLNAPEQLATFDTEFAEQCNRHMNMSLPFVDTYDQAYAILFFASDESKGITGQQLVVDNGITL